MISELDNVRVITNDAKGNKRGDFAAVRIQLQLVADHATYVDGSQGWKIVGFSYTARTRLGREDYVDLVYRFGGGAR